MVMFSSTIYRFHIHVSEQLSITLQHEHFDIIIGLHSKSGMVRRSLLCHKTLGISDRKPLINLQRINAHDSACCNSMELCTQIHL